MPRKNLVNLSEPEREQLQKVSRSTHHSVREKTRARILLLSDLRCPREQGGSHSDTEIAGQLGCSLLTVSNVRSRAAQRGALKSIRRSAQAKRKARKLDGRQEAQLVALTCSAPPEGHARWSLVLLRERLMEMEVTEHIGLETIRTTLKKTRSSRG